jgi:hypothetical protein
MRVRRAAMVAGVLLLWAAAACGPVSAGSSSTSLAPAGLAGSVTSSGGWGNAELVPGLESLDKGQKPQIGGISCASGGSCALGGSYLLPGSNDTRAFVASEMHGVWGLARPIPGLAQLDKGPNSAVGSPLCLSTGTGNCGGTVSCESAGNCTLAGWYSPVPDRVGPAFSEPFIVSQVRGAWLHAHPVPGLASLNTGRAGGIAALSCTGPGDCSAVGFYTVKGNPFSKTETFVVTEAHGTWQPPREAPGTAALNTGGNAQLTALSCASPGNCAAGGFYTDRSGKNHAFVITEVNGRWLAARPVDDLPPSPRQARYAAVTAVSCAAPGDCTAGGSYPDQAGHVQAFVVDQINFRWGTAHPVAGIAALNKGESAGVAAMSCPALGACSAAGFYAPRRLQGGVFYSEPFVVSQVHGTWGAGRQIPGLAALDVGSNAQAAGLSCGSAGNCVAGGHYTDRHGRYQAFVVSQKSGTWSTPQQVPGLTALGASAGAVYGISCPPAAPCTAAGSIRISRPTGTREAAFVVSQN